MRTVIHRRSTLLALCCAALFGSAFAVNAQTSQPAEVAAPAAPAIAADAAPAADQPGALTEVAKADAAEATDKKVPFSRRCMQYTGSHIRAYDTRSGKRPCMATAPGTAYSKDDIDKTGQVDLGKALRQMDPAIKSN